MKGELIPSIGWKQHALVLVLTVAVVVDGLDVKLLSFAVPIIMQQWQVSKAAMGPALAAALLGMAFGAAGGGWLGDRLGRRTVILASLVFFGLATVAVALADGLLSLTVYRFVSGLGFGALTPNAYSLISEWLPVRARPRAVAWVSAGSPLGGMGGALLALWLLPTLGWKGCFLVVGAGTVGLAGVLTFWLPESVRFLLKRGQLEAAKQQWRKLVGSELSHEGFDADRGEPEQDRATPRIKLFSRGLLRLNAGATLCFFSGYFVNYVFSSWLPVIMTTAGFRISEAIQAGFVFNSMAIVGVLLAGPLVDRRGTRWVLIASSLFMLAALGILPWLLIRHTSDLQWGAWASTIAFGLVGTASGSTASTISAVVASGYPTERRSSGVGLGVMAGRLGGVVASFTGGALLSIRGNDPAPLFWVLGFFTVLVILATLIIDRHAGGQESETAAGPRPLPSR